MNHDAEGFVDEKDRGTEEEVDPSHPETSFTIGSTRRSIAKNNLRPRRKKGDGGWEAFLLFSFA